MQARSADAFVDSIGVELHLGFDDTVYGRFDRVRRALDRLGVRYVRDGIGGSRPDLNARYRALAADGIELDAIIGDPFHRYGSGSIARQLEVIERSIGPGAIASIEGPNEFDISGGANWAPVLRSYVKRTWRAVRRRPRLASIPVLAPSLVKPRSRTLLGNIARWTDEGNVHPYPGGAIPDSSLHTTSELDLASRNTGVQPVQATETGYTNSVNQPFGVPGLQLPASERAAAVYMPRLVLDNFRRGYTRSYIYELIDESADPGRTQTEAAFGLLRHDFTPKPAYVALRNLIALLSDPGVGFIPDQLSFSIDGGGPGLREVLLQKRDGSFYLALWNADSIWDQDRRVPLRAAPMPVTLRLEEPVTNVELYRPNRSRGPSALAVQGNAVALAVGPSVTVLRIDTPGSLARQVAGWGLGF